jgi:uncharacterized alkaline shock family protein YloU
MEFFMTEETYLAGKTTIDPEVLITIVRLTALGVEGVSSMAAGPHNVDSLLRRSYSNGVKVEVENNTVYVDLYLKMKRNVNLLEISRKVQQKIKRAILEMVGMEIGTINIHIEDIDYKD